MFQQCKYMCYTNKVSLLDCFLTVCVCVCVCAGVLFYVAIFLLVAVVIIFLLIVAGTVFVLCSDVYCIIVHTY